MRATSPHAPLVCTGGCDREMAMTNQPSLDHILTGAGFDVPAPHHKYTTVCVDCVSAGYRPQDEPSTPPVITGAPVQNVTADEPPEKVLCLGCDTNLTVNPNPTLDEAAATSIDLPVPHRKHPNVCTDCMDRGFVPPKTIKRRDVVIENCEFYLANSIGLNEAAQREGYADRSHLDSVLRRWGRLDLTHALGALDPIQLRDRA